MRIELLTMNSFQLSAFSFQLSAFSFQLSAFSSQLRRVGKHDSGTTSDVLGEAEAES
jgi:hypothetical protein